MLWVGTANGLNRMDVDAKGEIRFRRFLRKDGMADDAVASILGDDNEQLWLSTNSGITRLDMRSCLFRNYDSADGTVEGSYFDGAALRAADGTMYFGGFNGMTAFVPQDIHDNRVPPLVAITELQIFNKPVAIGRGEFAHVLKDGHRAYAPAGADQPRKRLFAGVRGPAFRRAPAQYVRLPA